MPGKSAEGAAKRWGSLQGTGGAVWGGFRRALLAPPLCRDTALLRAAVQGRTVLVTGASYGIGEATALLLGRAGAEVILLARTQDRLETLVQTLTREGHAASAYRLDLSCTDEVAPLIARIEARHPRIDVIVSNAGKSVRRSVLQAADRRDLERSLAVNFTGPAALIEALLPRMVVQGGGQIVNVSTVAARQPGAPRWASYQGSKAGFDLWLRGVGSELALRGVRVSGLYLPLVRTRMSAPTRLYAFLPALTPLEAAQAVAQLLVRPEGRAAPWWLFWTELAALLWPGAIHRVLSWTEARPGREP
ncbi:SDR family NAD(P)-dependent oxidoreductase [Deinococcus sp.]|uniref:SDR family NAD(P)-dependent oxidoreductase n=1 Tax=Deinococcus sp. TaxID=47478 RepID=UPI003C7C3501